MESFLYGSWERVAVFEDDVGIWALAAVYIGPANGGDGINNSFDDDGAVEQMCDQSSEATREGGTAAKADEDDVLDGVVVVLAEVFKCLVEDLSDMARFDGKGGVKFLLEPAAIGANAWVVEAFEVALARGDGVVVFELAA